MLKNRKIKTTPEPKKKKERKRDTRFVMTWCQ